MPTSPPAAPTRLIVALPTGEGRQVIAEIHTGADSQYRVVVTCWNGARQQGRSVEVPVGKAPKITALVDVVSKAIAERATADN